MIFSHNFLIGKIISRFKSSTESLPTRSSMSFQIKNNLGINPSCSLLKKIKEKVTKQKQVPLHRKHSYDCTGRPTKIIGPQHPKFIVLYLFLVLAGKASNNQSVTTNISALPLPTDWQRINATYTFQSQHHYHTKN